MQKNQHVLPNLSKHENQLPGQKTIAECKTNTAELENRVTKINSVNAELTKVAHIAIPTNVSKLKSKTVVHQW